jgi:hypothetical protein
MTKMPWDIVDPSTHGDIDEKAVFDAVGRALTEWEMLEVQCAKMFAVFVSANQKQSYHAPALRAYGAITSADTRFKMLQLASESYFEKRPAKRASFEKQWNEMLGQYKQYKDRRTWPSKQSDANGNPDGGFSRQGRRISGEAFDRFGVGCCRSA